MESQPEALMREAYSRGHITSAVVSQLQNINTQRFICQYRTQIATFEKVGSKIAISINNNTVSKKQETCYPYKEGFKEDFLLHTVYHNEFLVQYMCLCICLFSLTYDVSGTIDEGKSRHYSTRSLKIQLSTQI